ncbi:hypothetical protein HNO52_18680 [Billgrantia diversa]|uniref:c-type cytochrome n=1 Tax=Halomonas sp. MCCC 1A13316 TaxID=2733487 RepID=UPI0018A5AB16|nr:hypothetical protein [Halomonas sp. MCCC 1A13316]QOR40317.1 hypothetical protein HNO52_18680 [Halomonas sp. MCCC 1A13316]
MPRLRTTAAGPSLHALVGRPAGSLYDFDYAPVLEQADLTWNRENLDAFLSGPQDFLPGTRMVLWGSTSARASASLHRQSGKYRRALKFTLSAGALGKR